MASSIDSNKPVTGSPTTSSVRDNFQHAQSEINRLLRSSEEFRTNTGSVNALAADFGVDVALTAGARIVVKTTGANTGAVTLACDGGSPNNVKLPDGSSLIGGEIPGGTHFLDLFYDGTNWILLNPQATTNKIKDSDGNTLQSDLDGKLGSSATAVAATKWNVYNISTSQSGTDSSTIYFRT
jgi:hypothetical protein